MLFSAAHMYMNPGLTTHLVLYNKLGASFLGMT